MKYLLIAISVLLIVACKDECAKVADERDFYKRQFDSLETISVNSIKNAKDAQDLAEKTMKMNADLIKKLESCQSKTKTINHADKVIIGGN